MKLTTRRIIFAILAALGISYGLIYSALPQLSVGIIMTLFFFIKE